MNLYTLLIDFVIKVNILEAICKNDSNIDRSKRRGTIYSPNVFSYELIIARATTVSKR